MKLTTIFAAFTTTFTMAQAVDIQPLILGGKVVPIGQKTYTVGLRASETGEAFCGGALITPTHVLTAAHCAGEAQYVSIGSHYQSGSKDGERIAVKNETPHPSFTQSKFSYDYSIIELAEPSTFMPIPLSFVNSEKFVGSTATTMGWGDTKQDAGTGSSVLRRVDVPVLSNAQCKAAKLEGYPISSTMFCAGGVKNKDSCQGDSGGPLILELESGDVLIGVVSWGDGCGLANKPGVYSKVNVAKSWIDANAPNTTWVTSIV